MLFSLWNNQGKTVGGVFNATFNNMLIISWRKPEYPEKTTDKLYHIMLYQAEISQLPYDHGHYQPLREEIICLSYFLNS